MIKINLARKKHFTQSAGATATAKAASGKSMSAGLSSIGDSIRGAGITTLFGKVIIPIVLCVGAYFAFDHYLTQQRELMQSEVAQIESEKSKVQAELNRIKGFESVKAELEKNEKILKNKIDTIQRLVTNRDFAFKSLMSLSGSLPREVWLNELTETEQGFNIKGNATDVGLVSDLMTRLGQTAVFKEVTLTSTKNDPALNKAVFELTARRE